MKGSTLWKVSVTTSPDAEDAVSDLLGTVFGEPACSYTDADSQQVTVSVYLPRRPPQAAAAKRELALGLERMAREGLEVAPGHVWLGRIRREEWAESWRRHFKPLMIGSALLIKPSWSRRRARRGQAVVVLDPGLSFGTGHHPTTAFCLRQLAALRRRGEPQSCLDVGSGSGILAIAAARLGYGPVVGLDCDSGSIRIARDNARRNGVARRIRFFQGDLTRLPRRSNLKYSVVCANLVASLLVAERERILARLHPDGALIAAGILKTEFEQVQGAFERAGLRLKASRKQNEWCSGAFAWRPGASAPCPDSGEIF
jgi:ribosomal protein L11 methyltransferase